MNGETSRKHVMSTPNSARVDVKANLLLETYGTGWLLI